MYAREFSTLPDRTTISPRRMALLVLALTTIVVRVAIAAGESSQDLTGQWTGEAIDVRWRNVDRTHYGPDTIVEVENKLQRSMTIRFDWVIRECNGKAVALEDDARFFLQRLYASQFAIDATLRPGEWDAFVFPRGVPPKNAEEATGSCVVRIKIRRVGTKEGADQLELVLPASPPPVRMRE